ncbi:protein of unknown function [Vibrio tapetis subsp. tapetis]|uniref:Uncharacterized protein n=1 Tax=Vibrio tapetis subsp. tapetis TaxID=1671868 RepID=A0A2N8ZLQ7_9VIBR|nr:protein of unknown function [Vibrio tapetis subsp. tapetis]
MSIGLHAILHAYPPKLPNQVHFRCVRVNFLSLPSNPAVGQQRPCDSDYLPLNQGDLGFFQPNGFASFAGQTKKAALSELPYPEGG